MVAACKNTLKMNVAKKPANKSSTAIANARRALLAATRRPIVAPVGPYHRPDHVVVDAESVPTITVRLPIPRGSFPDARRISIRVEEVRSRGVNWMNCLQFTRALIVACLIFLSSFLAGLVVADMMFGEVLTMNDRMLYTMVSLMSGIVVMTYFYRLPANRKDVCMVIALSVVCLMQFMICLMSVVGFSFFQDYIKDFTIVSMVDLDDDV